MQKVKILGKPYAGKPHVRIDEGEKEARSENEASALYRLFLFSTLLAYSFPSRGYQNSALPGNLGKGITSRMFVIPVTNSISLSKPRPKPL
jgi:hypothetical protein